MHNQIAKHIAQELLRIGAIKLSPEEPFRWASGWSSPIYCDNRLSLSFPAFRTYIKNALAQAIRHHFPSAQAIAGVATAGVPQGALVADVLELPFLYVRPKPKEHGTGNQIEGQLTAGQKIVLIEDLISTGGSSLKAAQAVQDAGGEVLGMVAIFTYGFELSVQQFAQKHIPVHCLSNYTALLEVAVETQQIEKSQIQALAQWRANPENWKK